MFKITATELLFRKSYPPVSSSPLKQYKNIYKYTQDSHLWLLDLCALDLKEKPKIPKLRSQNKYAVLTSLQPDQRISDLTTEVCIMLQRQQEKYVSVPGTVRF